MPLQREKEKRCGIKAGAFQRSSSQTSLSNNKTTRRQQPTMKVSIFASLVLLLSAFAALGHTAGINILPNDAAVQLRHCASAAGWRASNIRKDRTIDAVNNRERIDRSIANFKRIMAGIISERVANKIRSMFVSAGWHTANTRFGPSSHAARDKERVISLHGEILESGEIDRTLLNNIRNLGWASAWYAANFRAGNHGHAARDRENIATRYDSIRGTVTLVDVEFLNDEFESSEVTTTVVFEKRFPNCGSAVSLIEISDEMSRGRTDNFTHVVGFKYSITELGFSVELKIGNGLGARFEFSESRSVAESFEITTTREYYFTLPTSPHSTRVATGKVDEVTGSVPYEMTFDFGGAHKTIRGTWSGVLLSKIGFSDRTVTHNTEEC